MPNPIKPITKPIGKAIAGGITQVKNSHTHASATTKANPLHAAGQFVRGAQNPAGAKSTAQFHKDMKAEQLKSDRAGVAAFKAGQLDAQAAKTMPKIMKKLDKIDAKAAAKKK
jgi:hypothetical protein